MKFDLSAKSISMMMCHKGKLLKRIQSLIIL
jgi:hypothetical protein